MQDVLIIPTFDRPEFLWLCLSYLDKCHEISKMRILVRADAHIGHYPPIQDIEEVLEKFSHLAINFKVREPHNYHGNSYNVMVGYAEAVMYGPRYIFMVEDDVLIDPHFFEWHYEQHARFSPVVSVAVEAPEHRVYRSLGVCFPTTFMKKIVRHATPSYFSNMRDYCDRTFAPSAFDVEQDGLIARVILEHENWLVSWPIEPLAQHVGYYGYHRPLFRPEGTLEERFVRMQKVLNDQRLLALANQDFKDIKPLK